MMRGWLLLLMIVMNDEWYPKHYGQIMLSSKAKHIKQNFHVVLRTKVELTIWWSCCVILGWSTEMDQGYLILKYWGWHREAKHLMTPKWEPGWWGVWLWLGFHWILGNSVSYTKDLLSVMSQHHCQRNSGVADTRVSLAVMLILINNA